MGVFQDLEIKIILDQSLQEQSQETSQPCYCPQA